MNRDLLRRADVRFTSWQRGLVFETKVHGNWDDAASEVKGPIRQRQTKLIESVSDGPVPLGRYLRTVLGLTGDEQIAALPFPRKALTPNEFREPPVELEQELGEAWKSTLGFRPALASSPLYWLLCHVVWIEEGRLGDSGVPLEQALLSGSDAREAQIRNFLRRTGGLPRIRGNTSVFSDCLLARAWWRFRLAEEVAETTGGRISREAAHWLFHCHGQSWETLVTLSLKRITTINQKHARAAMAHHLGARVQTNGGFDQNDVKAIATSLARASLRRSLDYIPLEELYEMELGG